jgi:myo-inositol-1(or 4)-monophosphatase
MVFHNSDWMALLEEIVVEIKSNIYKIYSKKSELTLSDFKRLLDKQAQEAITKILTAHGSSALLISEEGNVVHGDGEYIIIADPIDGTTNMARGLPPAVTAILVSESHSLSGAIASLIVNLFTGEVYKAEKGKGGFLNTYPIKPAEYRPLRFAMSSIDISKHPKLDRTSRFLEVCKHLRELGCSAMSLCRVADGALDAHVDIRGTLRNTDVAAALMILKEVGGVYAINGQIGADLDISKLNSLELVAASSDELLCEIIDTLG